MERGLLWLPLLVAFFWLAWAGWNEYQKVEGYKVWAQKFQRAKYDIYAVLGQNGRELTWGKPTRRGIAELQTLSLEQVKAIQLKIDGQVIADQAVPSRAKSIALEFTLADQTVQIPFTEADLASQWAQMLRQELSQPSG
jgi:hypothetical protein